MRRKLAIATALFLVSVFVGSLVPTPPVAIDTKTQALTQTEPAHQYLSAVSQSQIPTLGTTKTIVTEADINARFTGMLLHLKWLMREGEYGGVSREFFDKQISSILDDVDDSNDEGGGSGLPSTFVIDDSGNVTSGAWLASAISDTYISDTLTLGASSILADNLVTPNSLLASGQVDEYCLTYELTGDTWEWQTCGSGGGSSFATTSINTSLKLANIVTDETGTGALVFAGSPTLTGTLTAASANFSGNVGVGTTTPTSRLYIDGTVAENVTLVSVGPAVNQDPDGWLDWSSAEFRQRNNPTGRPSAITGFAQADIPGLWAVGVGAAAHGENNSGTLLALKAVFAEAEYSGLGTVTTSIGGDFLAYNYDSGTVTNNFGLRAQTGNDFDGIITNNYGLMINSAYNDSGTISNNYGLYVQDQSGEGSLNSYNLYSAGASSKNYFAGSLGVGSTSPSAKLTIQNTGSGNSFIVEDQSGDTTPFVIDADGNVRIGTGLGGGPFSVGSYETITSGIKYLSDFNFESRPGANSTANISGLTSNAATQSGTGFNHGTLRALRGTVFHQGTGVLSNAYGVYGYVGNDDTGTISNAVSGRFGSYNLGGGTITNLKYIEIEDVINAGSTITNTYGLYVGDITSGTQTNQPYSIYASDTGARSYFAGNTGIGTSTPNEKLTVEGNINISSATGAVYFDDTRFLSASSTNHSVVFGEQAGTGLSATDLYNIVFGYQAGRSADSNNNIFAGTYAGYNSSGQHNYIFGYNAGYNNNGAANFIMGPDAGYNSIGGNNFIFGDDAGYNNAGTENIIFGTNAGYGNSGSSNFILGASAGYSSTGSNNLFIGEETGYYNTGSGNILLGYHVANNLTSGSRNIVIGYDIDSELATTSNSLNIGNLIFGTGLDGTGTTLSSGNVGIGTTTPGAKLQVENIDSVVSEGIGLYVNTTVSPSSNLTSGMDKNGIYSYIHSGNTNTVQRLTGLSGYAESTLAQTVAALRGASAVSYNEQATVSNLIGAYNYAGSGGGSVGTQAGLISDYDATGGTVTNAYGLWVRGTHSGATVTNRYGVRIEAPTGSATNDFGFYQAGTQKNYFAGNVGIGTTSPYAKLSVSGTGVFTGTADFLGDISIAGIANLGGNSYVSSNGSFRSISGSVAQPAYGFENDTNTGWYNPGDGAIRFSSNAADVFSITSSGNVGIGTTTPVQKLQVFGDVRVGTSGSNGCVENYGGGVIGGTCSSDERLKDNVEPLAEEGRSYIESLAALTPVTYNWNEEAAHRYSKDKTMGNIGLIAQDVELQFPELISRNKDGFRQVDFTGLQFYVIQALKELWAKVQGHDERIESLEQENESLKNRLEEIENELNITPTPEPVAEEPSTTEPNVPTLEEVVEPEVVEEITEPLSDVEESSSEEEPTYVLVPAEGI